MNKKIILAVAVSGIFFLMGNLSAEEAAKQPAQEKKVVVQEECPVMGGKINKSLFVDAKGKRIYVCCGGCIAKVKADPEKYIKELEAKGITLDETPKDKAAAEKKTEAPKAEKKDDGHAGHQH